MALDLQEGELEGQAVAHNLSRLNVVTLGLGRRSPAAVPKAPGCGGSEAALGL